MPGSTRPGDVLGDRYRLDDLLSESGSGRFWRAHDRVLRRHVALHVMAADDDRVHLLLDAARRSATVSDARVLRVLDAEQLDDICFVVNEWGYGTSLDIALANNGPLPPRKAAWLVGEVADSMVAAHERGVSHGRLAPENVLIDETGDVRIIGLCVDAALHGLPPGSVQHDLADLGGLLHAALTGRWAGVSPSAVTAAPQAQGRLMRPRQVRAGVPRLLDDLVDELVNPVLGPLDPTAAPGRADSSAVHATLTDFVGDPSGIPRSMALANPLPPPDVVVLPQVPDIVLRIEPPPAPVPVPSPAAAAPDPVAPDPVAAVVPGSPEGPPEGPPEGSPPGVAAAGPSTSGGPRPVGPPGDVRADHGGGDRPGHPDADPDADSVGDAGGDAGDGAAGGDAEGAGSGSDSFGGRPLFAPAGAGDLARRARAERIGRAGDAARRAGGGAGDPRDPHDPDATGLTRPVRHDEPVPDQVAPRVPGRRWLRLAWAVAILTLLVVIVSVVTDDTGTPQPTDQVVPTGRLGSVVPPR